MNCLNCTHWSLKRTDLAIYGFGRCKAETAGRQAVHHVAALNVCRIKRFQEASPEVIAKRMEKFP
uniref:Uncharacterized protein n=1 Tax=Variovorax paradoxus (strain S110) TaxID=543728 RepID=C5CJN5_VARPS